MSWEEANKQMTEIFNRKEPGLKDIVNLLRIQLLLIHKLEERVEDLTKTITQPVVDDAFLDRREEVLKQVDNQSGQFFQNLQNPDKG